MQYTSYRELTLSATEGRLQEEFWFVKCGSQVKDAVGYLQDGLGNSLIANAGSMEVHRIRKALGLPSGDIFTDEMEAFDRRSRDEIIIALGENARLDPPFIILASEMIASTTLRVLHQGLVSKVFQPQIGVAQGRKLSLFATVSQLPVRP